MWDLNLAIETPRQPALWRGGNCLTPTLQEFHFCVDWESQGCSEMSRNWAGDTQQMREVGVACMSLTILWKHYLWGRGRP